MNRSLSNITTSPHIQQHELCRQQSQCYLLAPPPRPPSIPDLFLATTCRLSSLSLSSSTFTNVRQRTESSSLSFFTIIAIVVGILIALTSTCLILFLFIVKFQCYHKLRHCRRTTAPTSSSVNSSMRGANNSDVAFIKTTNTNGGNSNVAGCASFSSVAPTSYGCLTPSTTTTTATHHPYRSLRMAVDSNLSLHIGHSQQNLNLNSDENSPCHHHSGNIYEEIRPSYNPHRCCCCCSCTLAHYHQQQQQAASCHQLAPHYYTCEPPTAPSSVVCQSCLLETLHRKQQQQQHTTSTTNCACHNFFVPIK